MFNLQYLPEQSAKREHLDSRSSLNWKEILEQDIRERLSNKDRNLRRHYHLLADKIMIEQALRHSDGNKSKAAKMLGMSRVTLRIKIEEYSEFLQKKK